MTITYHIRPVVCMHVQRAHGLQYIGVVDSGELNILFVMPMGYDQ